MCIRDRAWTTAGAGVLPETGVVSGTGYGNLEKSGASGFYDGSALHCHILQVFKEQSAGKYESAVCDVQPCQRHQ